MGHGPVWRLRVVPGPTGVRCDRSPVTVILPTHDHAALLPFAIASVTEQSFGDPSLWW